MDNGCGQGSLGERRCRCMAFATELRDGAELPDHVGEDAMRESCANWLGEAFGHPFGDGERVVMPIGDGRFTLPTSPWDWPIPVEGSAYRVTVAIRQWVEEQPDEQLGTLLQWLPAWTRVMQEAREWSAPEPSLLRDLLLSQGLPGTPGTARFLWQTVAAPEVLEEAVAGGYEMVQGPTRGLLVTSLVLETPEGGGHDEVASLIASVAPWTTDALRRRASKLAADHARWWASLPQASLPDLDLRRLNRRRPDDLTDDIVRYRRGELSREELDERALARAKELLGERWNPGERRKALRRVAHRLRHAEQTDRW